MLKILFYYAFFFLIIDLYGLILTGIAQIFNPKAELVIAIGIPAKEAKTEIKTQQKKVEAKTSKCSI